MWSGKLPTASNTFGNPSYSARHSHDLCHQPDAAERSRLQLQRQPDQHSPTGIVRAPSGFTFNRLFTGPNNDTRIPKSTCRRHRRGLHNQLAMVNKADDYQIRDDISWTKGAHQFKIGGSWALYKKVQDLFGNTQGAFNFNGSYTGVDFADFLLGYGSVLQRARCAGSRLLEQRFLGRLCTGQLAREQAADLEPGSALGRCAAHLRSQQSDGQLLSRTCTIRRCADLRSRSNGNRSIPASPGLGTSPNPILAGYQFYLNGIGIPGTTPGVPKGLVNNHWAAFGPRLGFAYDLTGLARRFCAADLAPCTNASRATTCTTPARTFRSAPTLTSATCTLDNPRTDLASGTTLAAPITVASITGLAVQNKLPVAYQYSFGVQHPLSVGRCSP